VPFIIHAELPSEKEIFIARVLRQPADEESLAITLSTDIELPMVRKIEQAIGQKIPLEDLPDNLIIDAESRSEENIKDSKAKHKISSPEKGAAFHEKKASNSKDYNYSSGLKAKMNKKKNH